MSLSDLSIQIQDRKVQKIYGLSSCTGEIKIGEFRETFISPLDWWTIEDYEKQWQDGIDRIKHCNESCLVTMAQNLETSPQIDWWILYKKNGKVLIYNQLLIDEIIGQLKYKIENLSQFTPQTCYSYIPPYKLFAKNSKASKWEITLE